MKTTTGYTFFEKTIIDNIDLSGYDVSEAIDLFDKVQKTHEIFKSEYGHVIDRVGELNAFHEWLMGLPTALSVPCYYNDIIANYNEFTGKVMTDSEENSLCNTYFEKLAKAFFVLKDNL